jgi:hypothetical protein
MSKIKDPHKENQLDSNQTEYKNRANLKHMNISLSKGEIAECFHQTIRGIKINHK